MAQISKYDMLMGKYPYCIKLRSIDVDPDILIPWIVSNCGTIKIDWDYVIANDEAYFFFDKERTAMLFSLGWT